ncbi:KLTH0H04356p [Lachancea thermotolerans CBS 6340]|uniref:KLTH0H04356p n=1 Tax=Lachancea thermotolerans (strain ATCC 56472 / CBS 6340 / NRRL Y-8284) TaxID=559295 RepID=C5E2E9_LACTC|nr:KLTH0H04356p [Lachancea thermotolerans CBS 6340]CAR30210.1 KLTH0H04356p [Lachancea thermotolerans CBS 6340]
MLQDPVRSYPRTKFWSAVSESVHVSAGLTRNSRQCRDRFNLLFSRALLTDGQDVGAGVGLGTDATLDAKLAQCTARFRFGNGRSLELKQRRSHVQAPTRVPQRGCAVHELIHPPEHTPGPMPEPGPLPSPAPGPTPADLSLIHTQLREVHRVLEALTAEVVGIQHQVRHLQQAFRELQDARQNQKPPVACDEDSVNRDK